MREKNVTKISIIIPVYNVENYLARCLDSIFKHTIPKFEYEVLLVDDGSTDGSGNICDKYEKDYEIVQAIHKENGGVSSARNIGLQEATGEYIAFVDPDDWIDTNALELLWNKLEATEASVLQFDYALFLLKIPILPFFCQAQFLALKEFLLLRKYALHFVLFLLFFLCSLVRK